MLHAIAELFCTELVRTRFVGDEVQTSSRLDEFRSDPGELGTVEQPTLPAFQRCQDHRNPIDIRRDTDDESDVEISWGRIRIRWRTPGGVRYWVWTRPDDISTSGSFRTYLDEYRSDFNKTGNAEKIFNGEGLVRISITVGIWVFEGCVTTT